MRKTTVVWKKVGETPLERIEMYRKEAGIALGVPLAYAGRLDPLAEGKLLVLIGDECKKLKKYTGLDKEYSFEVLFGFSSDTGDVLGLAEEGGGIDTPTPDTLRATACSFVGTNSFLYPKFSSKTVQGKPLHTWTLEGRINEIEIPVKESAIYKLHFEDSYLLSKEELKYSIFEKINSIPPVTDESKALGRDFRRVDIRARWNELFEQTRRSDFLIARFVCVASSGTYMRTLAGEIGKAVGSSGLAFSIKRTNIGTYVPFLTTWLRRF